MFVVFYSGERARNKIVKIFEAFGANRYPFRGPRQTISDQYSGMLRTIFVFKRIKNYVHVESEA